MSKSDVIKEDPEKLLENITNTVLYEGYALFPYHRNAVKNQLPIPIGVIYPQDYHSINNHSPAEMQTECILTGSNPEIKITVRFLHLKQVHKHERGRDTKNIQPPGDKYNLQNSQPTGWQTVERKIDFEKNKISELFESPESFKFHFEEEVREITSSGEADNWSCVSAIKGTFSISASKIEKAEKAWRIRVNITNKTPVPFAAEQARNMIFLQSFLSANTVMTTSGGKFISMQNPGQSWKQETDQCVCKNAWPILIDKDDSMLLSSPIILYDHPEINPKSKTDLFDSLEIEEALMLHFAAMSDEEKNKIAGSDERLAAMLQKVGDLTPDSMLNLHGGFSNIENEKFESKNK